jgi:hypothetical protein
MSVAEKKVKVFVRAIGLSRRLAIILLIYSIVAIVSTIHWIVTFPDYGNVFDQPVVAFLIFHFFVLAASIFLVSSKIWREDNTNVVRNNETKGQKQALLQTLRIFKAVFASYIVAVGISIVVYIGILALLGEQAAEKFLRIHSLVVPTITQLLLTAFCFPFIYKFIK